MVGWIMEPEWIVNSKPQVVEEEYDILNPTTIDYIIDKISYHLDGEDDPDYGLFFLTTTRPDGLDIRVMTEDNNGREFEITAFKVTVERIQ